MSSTFSQIQHPKLIYYQVRLPCHCCQRSWKRFLPDSWPSMIVGEKLILGTDVLVYTKKPFAIRLRY